MPEGTEAAAVAKIVQESQHAGNIPLQSHDLSVSYVLVPDGFEVREIDLAGYGPRPVRSAGTVDVHDAGSFLRTVNLRRGQGQTAAVYADVENLRVEAILDDDASGAAGWRQYRVAYALRRTPEYLAWLAINEKYLPQTPFANFIEDRAGDFRSPDAASMLEIAQKVEGTRTTKIKAGQTIHSGLRQFRWEESDDIKGGSFEIPTRVTIGIRLFYGQPPFEVEAALRYRINDSSGLAFAFKLLNVDRIEETVFGEVVTEIGAGREALGWMDGTAEDIVFGPAPAPRADPRTA